MLQVLIFDEENEKDLAFEINRFLKGIDENNLIEIRYSNTAFITTNNEQVYCYSALILYRVVVK